MTLKGKFLFWSTLLLLSVVVVGVLSIFNLISVRQSSLVTLAEYEAMDRSESVAAQVAWLRDALIAAGGTQYRDIKFFDSLQTDTREIVGRLTTASRFDAGDSSRESELAETLTAKLNDAAEQARPITGESAVAASASASRASRTLDEVNKELVEVGRLMPLAARRHIVAARDRASDHIVWTTIGLAILIVLSAAMHYRQYRLLVRPLLMLRESMRRGAANNYKEQVLARGEREFRDVATAFNGLAKDLAELYRSMEDKIIARSRELVRSERLASVGFLAAGVAHEINNPLSIISGYAELAVKSLKKLVLGSDGESTAADPEAEAQAMVTALQAQEIIRDESFRCKEITNRLLSLARGGGDGRQKIQMDDVARQVSILTQGLKNYRDRRIVLDFESSEPLDVMANPSEMKQVLLNLTVNALEAVPPERGEVRIGGRRSGQWVELSIEDNGKGMSAQTLEHVFEPFFTAKRGAGEPGTGLGLSITHAIVENHGGGIRAESMGPGRGSRFTLRLPAVAHDAKRLAAV